MLSEDVEDEAVVSDVDEGLAAEPEAAPAGRARLPSPPTVDPTAPLTEEEKTQLRRVPHGHLGARYRAGQLGWEQRQQAVLQQGLVQRSGWPQGWEEDWQEDDVEAQEYEQAAYEVS